MQSADKLMMHEVIYLNEKNCIPDKYETNNNAEDVWYLENGASNHMTGDKRYFLCLDNSITGKVRFGEPRRMTDVYFISELKSNIISLGQATESGCDIRLRGEHITMLDQNGKLLVKENRSKNRLYKVHMRIEDASHLYLSEISESNRWHARLGHVNTATMKIMIQKELVKGVPDIEINKEVCSSCLLDNKHDKVFHKRLRIGQQKCSNFYMETSAVLLLQVRCRETNISS